MKKTASKTTRRKTEPALSPEDREQQMISLAVNLAEQKLLDGTAPAQIIVHYLKLATTREKIEKEILEKQRDYLGAKTESLELTKTQDEKYDNLLKAMRRYSGNGDDEYYD